MGGSSACRNLPAPCDMYCHIAPSYGAGRQIRGWSAAENARQATVDLLENEHNQQTGGGCRARAAHGARQRRVGHAHFEAELVREAPLQIAEQRAAARRAPPAALPPRPRRPAPPDGAM